VAPGLKEELLIDDRASVCDAVMPSLCQCPQYFIQFFLPIPGLGSEPRIFFSFSFIYLSLYY
jgi:hypothetical protein